MSCSKENKRPMDSERLTPEQEELVVGGTGINYAAYNTSMFNTSMFNTSMINNGIFNVSQINNAMFNTTMDESESGPVNTNI